MSSNDTNATNLTTPIQTAGSILLAATPIGDTDDASPRLVRALQEADLIGAEDTRKLLALCGRLGIRISAKVIALHEHNENEKAQRLIEAAEAGLRVMVVSDAGMPTVSDPGFRVASTAAAQQIKVSALPGPSAVLTALAVSGLPSDRFCFDGFIPRKGSDRRKFLENLQAEPRTIILLTHRNASTKRLQTWQKSSVLNAPQPCAVNSQKPMRKSFGGA